MASGSTTKWTNVLSHKENPIFDQICMLFVFALNSNHLILWENVYAYINKFPHKIILRSSKK